MSLPKGECPLCDVARREERTRIVAWLRKKAEFMREGGKAHHIVQWDILRFTAAALEAGSMDIEEGREP